MASYDEAIPPGQAGKVTATVKTERYRGELQKGVTVTTSDPTRPQAQLTIKFNVVGSVVVLPRAALNFPSGPEWDYSGEVVIRKDPTETGELRVADLTTSVPWLVATARRVEHDEPGADSRSAGDYVIAVSVANDAPRTRAMQQVQFKTGLPREPEVSIPVSVGLDVPMRITPPVVHLRQPEAGQKAVGRFAVVVRPGLEGALEASASPDQFRVALEPDGPRHYAGTVTWTPSGEDVPSQGTLVLRAGAESQQVAVRVAGPGARNRPRMPPPAPSPGSP